MTELDRAIAALNELLSNPQANQLPPEALGSHPGFAVLYQELAALRQHLMQISRGDLGQTIQGRSLLTGCLKSLQANLRHLTWQTQMIAEGDFSQRVDFLGDFSAAFNFMTEALAKAKADLAESEGRYRLLAENAADVIVTLDHEGRFTYVSPSVTQLLGYTPDQLVGRALDQFACHSCDPVPGSVVEMRLTCQDGSIRWAEMNTAPLPTETGRGARLVGVIRDITERKQLQDDLRQLATIDGLTGAVNRRHFMELGQQAIAESSRGACPPSLLLMDIDYFKQINDRCGHTGGDEVLRQVVQAGSRALRAMDAFGRVGGDEFAVLLPATTLADAILVAERLREIYEQLAVPLPDGRSAGFTVSIGVAQGLPDESSMESLLLRADLALYEAKNAGRNSVWPAPAPE